MTWKYFMQNPNDVRKSKFAPKIQDPKYKIQAPKSKRPCLGPAHEERRLINASKIQNQKFKIQDPKSKLHTQTAPKSKIPTFGFWALDGDPLQIFWASWQPKGARFHPCTSQIGQPFPKKDFDGNRKGWTRWRGAGSRTSTQGTKKITCSSFLMQFSARC